MPEPLCELEPDTDAGKAFVRAVKDGDAERVRAVLTEHPELRDSIDEPWFDFDAPAVVWCSGQLDRAKILVLLEFGASLDAKSHWAAGGYTALHHCVDGATPEKLDFAKFLIEHGATVDLHAAAGLGQADRIAEFLDAAPERVNEPGPDGATPLHLAASVEIAQQLLDRGADPTKRCVDHNSTPAMWLLGSHPEISRLLVERGGPADIFVAAALGDAELVDRCLAENPDAIGARVGIGDWTRFTGGGDKYTWVLGDNRTPHKLAYVNGHAELYRSLLERSPAAEQLLIACDCADRERAEAIAAENPNIVANLPPEKSRLLADAAWEGNLDAVRLMLDLGFDPHVVGDHNSTPLDRAAFHGFSEVVKLLLARDPAPPLTKRNEFGGMPLGTCLWGKIHGWTKDSDYPGTVRALLEAGSRFTDDWLPYPDAEIDAILKAHPDSMIEETG